VNSRKSDLLLITFIFFLTGMVAGAYLCYKVHPDIIHVDNEVTGDKFDLSDFKNELPGMEETKNYFKYEFDSSKIENITIRDLQDMYTRKGWKLISIRDIDSKTQYIFRR
jgi:hypothetical protein